MEIDITSAQDAKNLTNSPSYVKTINKIDEELMGELLKCDVKDKDLTQTIAIKIQQFDRIKTKIQHEADSLLLAQQQAEIEAEKIKKENKPLKIMR